MTRNRKKMALYEAINKSSLKPLCGKELQQLHPSEASENKMPVIDASENLMKWPRRPKLLQFNAGRIEMSVPYQLGTALLLGLVLLFLVVFRFGQSVSYKQKTIESVVEKLEIIKATAAKEGVLSKIKKQDVAKSASQDGNNRIVIQTYQTRAELEPVKEYFGQHGIETEIKKISGWYFLVTTQKYGNPSKSGTDGYLAKQKIINLGANYKAPPGYGSFGPKPFHDAYGKKFKD